ncbi:site-specific integrase [Photobacterium sp. MCCC 1A19761]|uniref:site-specific integrase n=1 Tax=Photobacterium sp. MCCC 1A19761 TaxID=3115000 RepID=UPI00307D1B6C
MGYSLRTVRLEDGSDMHSITDKFWCPYPYPDLYVHVKLWRSNIASNTVKRRAYELIFFLHWLESKEIDLTARTACGDWLTAEEIEDFSNDAGLNAKDAGLTVQLMAKKALQPRKVTKFPTLSDKFISNAIHSSKVQKKVVDAATKNGRLRTAAHYACFLIDSFHASATEPGPSDAKNRINVWFEEHKSKISRHKDSLRALKPAISDQVFDLLLDIIQENHKDNPFGPDPAVRARNRLFVELIAETGLRKGAANKIKLEDLRPQERGIVIARRPNDPDDPRRDREQQKTENHMVVMSDSLYALLDNYIQQYRNNTPGANSNDFLFVTHNDTKSTLGQPTSKNNVTRVFSQLRNKLRELNGDKSLKFHAHELRHKWNEKFTLSADRKLAPAEKVEQMRKQSLGNRQTADHYNRYQISEQAKRAVGDLQREMEKAREDRNELEQDVPF